MGDRESKEVKKSLEDLEKELEITEEQLKNGELEKVLEEMDRDAEFQCMSPYDAVEFYKPHGKFFSLTAHYNLRYDDEHPYGEYTVSDEHYHALIKELDERTKSFCRYAYDKWFSEEDKATLPPFEELYAEVLKEYEAFAATDENREWAEKFRGNVHIEYDHFHGKTRFTQPSMRMLYEKVDVMGACRFQLEKMRKNKKTPELNRELEEYNCYHALQESLKKVDVTFFPPIGGWTALMKVFYFEINETTLWWLKNRYYDIWEGFENVFNCRPPLKYFAIHDGDGKRLFWVDDDIPFQNGVIPDAL